MAKIISRRWFVCCSALLPWLLPFVSSCKRHTEGSKPNDLPVPLGKITELQQGLNPFPVYRVAVVREAESIRALSLVCTHQTCMLSIRPQGDGFDCPCHGSRFGRDGRVEIGPAVKPLPYYRLSIEGGEVFLHAGSEVSADWKLRLA